jgi:hypothetical protein
MMGDKKRLQNSGVEITWKLAIWKDKGDGQ